MKTDAGIYAILRVAAVCLMTLAAACAREPFPEPSLGNDLSDEGEYVPGELLVKFSPQMTDILDAMESGPATKCGIPSADEVLDILGAYSISRVFPVDSRNEGRTREAGLHLWYVVQLPQDSDLAQARESLSRLGEVSLVQCNRLLHRKPRSRPAFAPCAQADADALCMPALPAVMNDPYLACQWNYINDGSAPFARDWAPVIAGADAGCARAWELCTGDPSIIVAVLDEGVMYSHPDLAANIWVNEAEAMGTDCDADGNGYSGDRYGYNFTSNTGRISFDGVHDSGHGTHVAGTIAAVNNNGVGVCGIAGGDGTPSSGVRIMSCQVFDNGYTCTVANEARAMKYAADNGAVILQCSWGYNSCLSNVLSGYTPGPATEDEWHGQYPLEKEAIDYFLHNAGSPNGVIEGGLAFFASGNEYAGMSAFPAAYSGCISVSAISADYTPASYSNYGREVELCAPGGDIEYYCIPGIEDGALEDFGPEWVLQPQGSVLSTLVLDGKAGYGYYDGTSMACPHAAGVAALGLSYAVRLHKHFTAEEFRALMLATARDIDYRMNGEKLYWFNHTSAGASPSRMDLSSYRGRMGRLVDAGSLLEAVANAGNAMRVPNFYLAPMQTSRFDLSTCFEGGDILGYEAESSDLGVAVVTVSGSLLMVTGVAEGTATLVIRNSRGDRVTAAVTVRKNASSEGWL